MIQWKSPDLASTARLSEIWNSQTLLVWPTTLGGCLGGVACFKWQPQAFTGNLCIAGILVIFLVFPFSRWGWCLSSFRLTTHSRHLLTFHFTEDWSIIYFEAIPGHPERKPVAYLDLVFMHVLYSAGGWNRLRSWWVSLSECHKFIVEGNIQICLWKGPQNHRGLWLHFSPCRG